MDAAHLEHIQTLGMVPLYHVEPIVFERNSRRMWRRTDLGLWHQTLRSITGSGVPPEAMAAVARNYAALARATPRMAMLLAYAWPSRIEWEDELGTRDLPDSVRRAHEEIGRNITGRN